MPRSSPYAPQLKQTNKQKSLPAPVGGLNARDSLAAMPPTQAIILDNWFPVQYGMKVRQGWSRWYTSLPGTAESLIKYNGPTGAEKLFAAANGNFVNVTAGGAYSAGDIVATGFANNRWQYVQMANEIATFTIACNGADHPQKYNGTTWTVCALTSLDVTFVDTRLISVTLMHRRLWFTEKNSTRIWYLPVDDVEGAVKLFDAGGVFPQGGYLQIALPWSVDTGAGMDDQSVFISSKGDIAVYTGIDPDTADAFTLAGTYMIGGTIGRRCACKFGSDVAILCEDGVMLLTQILAQSKMLMQPPLTTMIQHRLADDVSDFSALFGWELFPIQRTNQFYVNVPDPAAIRQYVQNTITDAWATFSGYLAQCWAKFNEEPFFGGVGYVGKAWDGYVDDPNSVTGIGTSIAATALQAFNYFDSPSQKIWNMCRPIFSSQGKPALSVAFNVDFEIDLSVAPPPVTLAGTNASLWDVALWDVGLWSIGVQTWKNWYTLNNIGFAGAIVVRTATFDDTSWISTDFVYLEGNVL